MTAVKQIRKSNKLNLNQKIRKKQRPVRLDHHKMEVAASAAVAAAKERPIAKNDSDSSISTQEPMFVPVKRGVKKHKLSNDSTPTPTTKNRFAPLVAEATEASAPSTINHKNSPDYPRTAGEL